jgi:hypothetical protein
MMSDADVALLYRAARRVADIFHEVADADPMIAWCIDQRHGSVNPYFNQTLNGLFLDYSYRNPSSIWTPWGAWSFRGGIATHRGYESFGEAFMERLEVSLFREVEDEDGAPVGSTYALLAVEGTKLPEPTLKEWGDFTPYDQAKIQWGQLTEVYNA